MANIDYSLVADCNNSCIDIFESYTKPGCDSINGELCKIALISCGADLTNFCSTVQADWDALIQANQAQVLCITGASLTSSEVTKEDPWKACGAGEYVDYYDKELEFYVKVWLDCETGANNHPFWKAIHDSRNINDFYLLTEGGITLHPEPFRGGISVSVDIDPTTQNNILAYRVVLRWKQKTLETPDFALLPVWE